MPPRLRPGGERLLHRGPWGGALPCPFRKSRAVFCDLPLEEHCLRLPMRLPGEDEAFGEAALGFLSSCRLA